MLPSSLQKEFMLGDKNHFTSEFSRLRRQTNDTKDLRTTLNIPRILYYILNIYSFILIFLFYNIVLVFAIHQHIYSFKIDKHYL